ncbi:MAG: hypothetical protein QW727_03485 [Candidatus Pacearchaeota archaeon]
MKEKKNGCELCRGNKDSIKNLYKTIQKKYDLPPFKYLDENFDISKYDWNKNTFLRDIRKMIENKFYTTLQFIELLLNPSNGSMFHFFLVNGMNGIEKSTLKNLFENLGEIEINSIALDINFDEKKEAEFIKNSCKSWEKIKPELEKIIDSIKSNWKKTNKTKGKSYFG